MRSATDWSIDQGKLFIVHDYYNKLAYDMDLNWQPNQRFAG